MEDKNVKNILDNVNCEDYNIEIQTTMRDGKYTHVTIELYEKEHQSSKIRFE